MNRGNSPLSVLRDPKNEIPRGEQDIRLDDYLNDKIQTTSDFKNLASLIASVEDQKKLLEEQLQDARVALRDAKKASADHTSQMLKQTREYERQYNKVQTSLMRVTLAETPAEAASRLKQPMEKLRRVELARSYVELLKEVDDLTKDARSHLPAEPKEALKPYTQLKELSISMGQLQDQAEGAAVHLVTHVQTTTERLWVQMKKIMSDEFESVLQKSKWPDSEVEPIREWIDCFGRLLDLQGPEIMAARESLVLLPMDVLAKHFILEFRYHFFTNKATNRANLLGQFFFAWFLNTVDKQQEYLRSNITPILATHFRETPLSGQSLYIDPVAGFVTALLPVVKEKVDSVLTQIATEPELLSQFISELLTFDQAVRDKFNYDGGNSDVGWKGLSWDVLDIWFDRWSQVEKDFALKRYQDINRSPDAGDIDYDGTPLGKTKTTYGAAKVTDLIATVTTTYNKLRKFSQRVRFLINIQAEILDQYLGRLKDSLEIYQARTSAVGRTLHGVTREQQAALEGIGGLESLCKVFGSAEHLISMLKEWSNEEFFIQLWEELQNRAKTTSIEDNLVGSMTYTEVKDVTSQSVGSDSEGSLFDVTIDNYEHIRDKAESLIEQAIKYSFPTTFKQYVTKAQWTTIGDVPNPITDLAVTAELDLPLQTLRESLAFLHRALAFSTYKRIWRKSSESLQELLFNEVLLKQDFTTLGAARLKQDFAAIQGALAAHSSTKLPPTMSKLAEGIALLNLPLEAEEGSISLKEASQEMFTTNTQTEQLLARLEICRLTNFEARSILQRRVEANDFT